MEALLKRMNDKKNLTRSPSISKNPSRSMSIASSIDNGDDNEDQMSNSDESTTRPKVKVEKKEDKKPAWGSVAKPEVKAKVGSRIDTNMVKLKLLDATRKAIIDKTRKSYTSSSTQTEHVRTKLMKDVLVDNQSDMIQQMDAETETEVELVAIKARDGNLIVTSTSAVNTDQVITKAAGCQTAMPRSSVSFKRFIQSDHRLEYDPEFEDYDDEFFQRQELEQIERRLKPRSPKKSPMNTPNIVVQDVEEKIGSDSEFEDSMHEDYRKHQPDIIRASMQQQNQPKAVGSTMNLWQDLDFPDNKPELPRTYFTDGPTPWSNFKDLVLGNRFLNARLSPIPTRERRPNKKEVSWSGEQVKVVSDLISEANALMDIFDQVAMLLGPDIKLHKVSDVEEFVLPPSKYNEELNKSCEKIEKNLQKLDNLHNSRTFTEKIPLERNN